MKDAREREPAYAKKEADQYSFDYEPIRGYPELRWTGKRPFRGTSYFPAQLKESHGDSQDGWRNKLYWGDNLQVMSHLLREYRGKVRLIYIDPPFDSKADYKKSIELRGMSAEGDASAFEEKQYSDIWTNDEYLQFMYERLILMRELLAEDGSIYVHCDWHKSHYIRCLLDEVFGYSNYSNEISRVKCNPKNSRMKSFGNTTDRILFFRKSQDSITWNSILEMKTEDEIEMFYEKTSKEGRRYTTLALHAPSISNGETGQAWKGILPPAGRHWAYLRNQLDEFDRNGLVEWSESGNPRLVKYADEDPGNRLQDIWVLKDPQYQIYPTEKNEDILDRIIKASSNPGDLVFDCFMGSGTTQAVAMKLGRRFLGADINLGAIQTTTKRLLGVAEEIKSGAQELALGDDATPTTFYTGFEVYTVNNYDFFRNELEAKELLIEALELQKLPGNMLWDGEQDGWMVKILAINRLATAADLNPILGNLDYKSWEKRAKENPGKSVERIRFVCMGHDPELRAQFQNEMDKLGFKVELEVLDILRDRQELQFKREAEAKIAVTKKKLEIKKFYPMNLMQKLSLERTKVGEWRELVDSVLIDWNYDGAVFSPTTIDIPDKRELVKGVYDLPEEFGTIRVKITDLLAESWEGNVGD